MSLAETLYEFGELLANNLSERGVQSSANDGLTTLADKILDVYTGPSTLVQVNWEGGDFSDKTITFSCVDENNNRYTNIPLTSAKGWKHNVNGKVSYIYGISSLIDYTISQRKVNDNTYIIIATYDGE